MRENERQKIEELLSAYLDDALTDRRRMEVRRLIENDAEAAALLSWLEKQKQLLNVMPTATAPAGLAGRVLAAAHSVAVPQTIVPADISTAVQEYEGRRQLYVRRVLTAAALVFIPVVALSLVVWTIVGPFSSVPGRLAELDLPAVEAPAVVKPVSFPLSASLYLTTSQATAMDSFIHKAIYKHDLTNDATTTGLGGGERTYRIRSDRQRIVALLGELASVWDKCESTAMTVHGRTMAVNARIENVRPDQAVALYEGDVFRDPVQLARQMSEMNRIMQGVRDFGERLPVMPELTSGQRRSSGGAEGDSQGYVTLYVNILSR